MRDRMSSSPVGVREEQGKAAQSNNGQQEERIFVAIRVRPLNERERSRHDVSDWECISDHTIRFKNNGLAEQHTSTFDRVFGERFTTQQVYEQGIKEVALSVVRGINSSIFAYGQTSSGKTYTMTGITEYAIKDIYEYIEKHREREFAVKFSAMEIYNEAVRDLLNANATSLRVLDDPEKGTVIEKLTEETLTERSRLQQLLSICAAERTTEETAMNEASSRSHQILRLTVESNPGNYVGTARCGTLTASVNFVDLAGSERASQSLSAGTRLREGSHINRSLLTLGTVIRKLSKGGNGHVPYRDSKLTRILHNSLGGNARTAIICTISPARSQAEQSKNTLFFAGCAKQVATNAQVNVVMSDKILVKQLQKELARMENELRSFNSIILKERELQIEQMDKEIKELTRQRDLFHSHIENLVQSAGKDRLIRVDKDWPSETSSVATNLCSERDSRSENLDRTTSSLYLLNEQPENSEDNFLLDGCPPTFVEAESPDPCQGWEEIASRAESEAKSEDNCKEVPCVEIKEVETDHKTNVNTSITSFEEKEENLIPVADEDAKSSSGNGHNVRDVLQQKTEDHKTNVNTSITASEEKGENLIPGADEDAKSSSRNGHSDRDVLQQKTEDHKLSVNISIPSFEEEGGNSHMMIPVAEEDAKSSSGNGHSDQDALRQKTEDHKTSVNTSTPAFEEEGGNSPTIQVVEEDAKSSRENGHVDQDALQQKTQDLERNNDHLVDLSEKSNGSSESRPHIMTAMPSPQTHKMSQDASLHPQVSKVEEQNVSPSRFSKLDQESASPHQFDEDDLKTMSPLFLDKQELKTRSPPQLEELDSFTLSDGVEREYSSNMMCFDEKQSQPKLHAKKRKYSRKYSVVPMMDASVEDEESVLDSDTEDTSSVINFVVKMNQRAKTKPTQKPFSEDFDDLMAHVNKVKGVNFNGISGPLMPSKFETQQRDIIKLWDACNVPLVHRSYFFLLIKGELPDSVYLDVELRRLSFLKDAFSSGITGGGLDVTPNSSLLSLNRERKMLSKQVHKKFSKKQREELYRKWRIDLKTKHRSIQLAWLLWTNTKDLNHARESAALVAKLVGLINSSETPKKAFGLGFLARHKSRKSLSWKDTMSTI